MQASRRAAIKPETKGRESVIITLLPAKEASIPSKRSDEDEKATAARQEPTPPSTPLPTNSETKGDNDSDKPQEKQDSPGKDEEQASQIRDPLTWFGILVPPSLRSAQASFNSVVDEPVTDAVNASRGMRETEIEINRLRKDIRKAERTAKELSTGA